MFVCSFPLATGCLAKYHGTHVWHCSYCWYSWIPLAASPPLWPFLCLPSLCPGSCKAHLSSTIVLQYPAALYTHEYPTGKTSWMIRSLAQNDVVQVGINEKGTAWALEAGAQIAFLMWAAQLLNKSLHLSFNPLGLKPLCAWVGPLPPISPAILLARFEYFRNLQSHRHGRMSASRAKFPSTAARLERQILWEKKETGYKHLHRDFFWSRLGGKIGRMLGMSILVHSRTRSFRTPTA